MDRTARRLLFLAMAAGVVGAVLAFALEDDQASAAGVDLRAFGLVLLAAALLLAAGSAATRVDFGTRAKETAEGEKEGKGKTDVDSLKVVTNLLAVVAGIVAVAVLTVVSAGLLNDSESTVAVTTAALGIISTVVTAYLGIKATANTSSKATDAAAELVKKLPNPPLPPP
jgi:uncharacterized membrane protein YfcA